MVIYEPLFPGSVISIWTNSLFIYLLIYSFSERGNLKKDEFIVYSYTFIYFPDRSWIYEFEYKVVWESTSFPSRYYKISQRTNHKLLIYIYGVSRPISMAYPEENPIKLSGYGVVVETRRPSA